MRIPPAHYWRGALSLLPLSGGGIDVNGVVGTVLALRPLLLCSCCCHCHWRAGLQAANVWPGARATDAALPADDERSTSARMRCARLASSMYSSQLPEGGGCLSYVTIGCFR